LLNRAQAQPGRLYAVNLLEAQKVIRDTCNPRFRTVLYRRLMMRIASLVAEAEHALALTTGENLGQVASQTLENLTVIAAAAEIPVLRPLLTADKHDTMEMARRIGTYDISIEDVPDSCTVFAPKRPMTKVTVEKVVEQETRLDITRLVAVSIANTVLVEPDSLEERVPERLRTVAARKGIPVVSPPEGPGGETTASAG